MNKEYKDFQRRKAKKASMASIEVPNVEKIRKLNDPEFHGQQVNRTADQIFDGEKFNKRGSFDRATKIYSDPARNKKEETKPEENFEDFCRCFGGNFLPPCFNCLYAFNCGFFYLRFVSAK